MNFSSVQSPSEPVFRISTFRNEEVLIFEPITKLTSMRIAMVFICVLVGLVTLINLIFSYKKYSIPLKQSPFYRWVIPFILLCNILFHVAHYAHNIYDPAGYFEPKYLYEKVIFSEMEKTFLFNFPLSIAFIVATRELLLSCGRQQTRSRRMLAIVTVYCLLSMISGGHYGNEPPWNFSLLHNVTIAGETLVALLLLLAAVLVYRSTSKQVTAHKYTRLFMDEDGNSNDFVSMTQQRQSKSKMSDNE